MCDRASNWVWVWVLVWIPMHDGFGCLISMSHVCDDDDWTVNITLNIAYTLHSSPHPSENTMNQQKRRLFYYFYYLLNGIPISTIRLVGASCTHSQTHSHISVSRHRFICVGFSPSSCTVHTLALTHET